MDTSFTLRFVFVSVLVTNLVTAQCPVSCRCSLWTIDCKSSQLTDVPGGQVLAHIMKLDLSYNMITTLHNNSFAPELSSVEMLVLANNNIKSIEVNALTKLDKLTFLDLSGNDISYISPEVLSGNTNLMGLSLSKNPNLKLPDNGYNLPELLKLELEQCRIKQIPAHFFKNMNNIIFLYLNINELSYLDPINFRHLTKLEQLDLSDNWFKVFQREFMELHSSTKLTISKNLWICDCHFLNALDYFERSGNKKPPICKSPKQLRGLDANRTSINELFHCNTSKTTTTTTTTASVFYDAFINPDWYDYDYDSGQDYSVEKLAHMIGVPDLAEGGNTASSPHPHTDEGGDILSAGVEIDASWFEEHQWWVYSAAVVLLAAVVAAIINHHVNYKRKRYLLHNDDV